MPKGIPHGIHCPTCLVGTQHPNGPWPLIRVRVIWQDGQWYSQCLVCAGGWDKNMVWSPSTYSEQKGWFQC